MENLTSPAVNGNPAPIPPTPDLVYERLRLALLLAQDGLRRAIDAAPEDKEAIPRVGYILGQLTRIDNFLSTADDACIQMLEVDDPALDDPDAPAHFATSDAPNPFAKKEGGAS